MKKETYYVFDEYAYNTSPCISFMQSNAFQLGVLILHYFCYTYMIGVTTISLC